LIFQDHLLCIKYISNKINRLREIKRPWEDSISENRRDSVEVLLEINEDMVIYQHDGCPFNGKAFIILIIREKSK